MKLTDTASVAKGQEDQQFHSLPKGTAEAKINKSFHIVSGTAPPYLSHSCFVSTLILALFAQPHILGYSVFLGWAVFGGEIF